MIFRDRIKSLLASFWRSKPKNDTFCILPWIHVDCLADSAVARICCSSYPVEQDHVPLSYYHHSTKDLCNSEYMKDVRRRMVQGQKVPACNICYINEANQVNSRRLIQNAKWKKYPELNFEKIIHDTVQNDFKVDIKPYFVQLNLGNLCNLKCRMCHAGNSTVIDNDPVQSAWSPPRYLHERLYWHDNKITLLPNPFIGCEYEGFFDMVLNNTKGFVSVSGIGKISLPVYADTPLDKLVLQLFAAQEIQKVAVHCNGILLDTISFAAGDERSLTYDLHSLRGVGRIEFSIGLPDGVTEKLQVKSLEIHKEDEAREQGEIDLVYCRTGSRNPWYIQEEIIFGDFLNDLTNVKEVLLTGGEPLLNPVTAKIIDFLIQHGMEREIALVMNTNTTYLPVTILDKLKTFKRVHMNLSIDSVGDVYEYIRFPAKWEKIKNNINMLKEKRIPLGAVPILQAYNVLNAVDLCRFFEENGVNYNLLMMHGPYFLHCALLPDPIRKVAADRLRTYAQNEAPQEKQNNLLRVAQSIENITINIDRQKALEDFMLFTNDLDRVNGQDIKESIPELIEMLKHNGVEWSSGTRFAALR
ncbi:MAG: twitch domain-containing radical SAM protein [Desulfobulbaceae bacterium]